MALFKEENPLSSGNKSDSKSSKSMEDEVENKAYIDRFMNQELTPETLTFDNEFFPNYNNLT